jgi:hypothetical protein
MREQRGVRRVLTVCVLVALAVPLGAQGTNPFRQEQQFNFKLQDFEAILRNAVKHGADVFAQQVAAAIPPNVQLTTDDPDAKAFAPPTPDGGLLFVVVVPPIRQIVTWLSQQYPRSSRGSSQPVRPVGAAGTATADPMTASPIVSGTAAPPLSADAQYSKAVNDALIDAMLDNSGALPLKDTEWLTIAAIDGVGPTPGAVNSPFGLTTYLSIKGSDLTQLRQGKLSREDARKLVVLKQL